MANWGVVIGIDQYWSEGACVEPSATRSRCGNGSSTRLAATCRPRTSSSCSPRGSQPGGRRGARADARHEGEHHPRDQQPHGPERREGRLYFFFAGHGLTTRVSNRDESALLATDFTSITDHSIALRSLWEFFETTQFDDQFLFVDACRNVPPWGEGARVHARLVDAAALRDRACHPCSSSSSTPPRRS